MVKSLKSVNHIKAKERVRKLKVFYEHLLIYLLINSLLILFAKRITIILLSKEALGNPEFLEWINWNLLGTPIIWGIVLLIHAFYIFIPSPFKSWEEKQIQKFIERDKAEVKKYR